MLNISFYEICGIIFDGVGQTLDNEQVLEDKKDYYSIFGVTILDFEQLFENNKRNSEGHRRFFVNNISKMGN